MVRFALPSQGVSEIGSDTAQRREKAWRNRVTMMI